MIFTRRDLEEKLGFKNEERKLVMKFQKDLPILSEDGEGFSVNARKLHEQLVENAKEGKTGDKFTQWIKRRIGKYGFKENEDYIFDWIDKNNSVHKFVNGETSQKLTALGYEMQYKVTLDMAKELCMVENNEKGKIARKYFILIEKALKEKIEWNQIREPEKESYKEMCLELDKYFQRNFNKRPQFYDYSNEADALNRICLGATSKEILKYFEAQDKVMRDHLRKEYNLYLSEIQKLNIMYLRMNMQKDKRYDLIKQGFKALYPFASYVIANKIN